MASRRTILILFSVLSAFVVSSKGATIVTESASTATSTVAVPPTAEPTTAAVPSPTVAELSTPAVPSLSVDPSASTGNATDGPPPTVAPTPEPTTPPPGDMEGFDDLGTVDYIIIGVTCGVCAGIIIGGIIIFARKRNRKGKEDANALVQHGHHPEYITELGEGVTNYKVEH